MLVRLYYFISTLAPTSKQRLLFLPWLTLDMIYIILTTILFVSWAFLSFFVHILVAIFFPVVSGAFLGLWIYAWRNVREHFIICGQRGDELELVKHRQSSTLYRKLPPASQSPTEMRIVPHYQHQVPVWSTKKCEIYLLTTTKVNCTREFFFPKKLNIYFQCSPQSGIMSCWSNTPC